MPRPKKTPDYVEGPQAFENFRNLASRIVQAGRPSIKVIETETTTVVEKRSQDVVVRTGRKRRRS